MSRLPLDQVDAFVTAARLRNLTDDLAGFLERVVGAGKT